jgi:hypothetical protein
MENTLSDKIDQYLDGKMRPEESASFEKELKINEHLRQQVEMQKDLRQGIERMNMKASINSQFKKMTLKSKLYKWGIATVAIAAIGTATYFGYNSLNGNSSASNYKLPALNEEGKADWSDADKNLPTQIFSIDPEKDTVLETNGGIVFAVPAGAFLNAKQPVTLEVREALTPSDIMKAGLSTTSDGKLLETGGMFYLNARNEDGNSLQINPEKPVYANVPTNEIKPDMQLFSGERKSDGSINWKNPKPLDKQLIPVDINTLDFYPKGFRAKVAELGFDANNKSVTDSIYYSYSGRRNFSASPFGGSMQPAPNVVTTVHASNNPTYYYDTDTISLEGKVLFQTNCASCHNTTNQMSTGPGLKGVLDRIPGGDWPIMWVRNSGKLISSGDKYANKIYNDYNHTVQTNFPQLTTRQIEAILTFANGPSEIKHTNTDSSELGGNILEINPARISAIWNDKFQNTIIATKEFEERLQVIFSKGCPELLDLYVNNLDKKMYQIDSMAMYAACSDALINNEFHNFYLRHDEGISITNSHMKKLENYFNMKRKAVQMASQKIYEARKEKEKNDDKTYSDSKTNQSKSDYTRDSANLLREFDVNLADACKQLGINEKRMSGNYYGFAVTRIGWCNVDRYVMESVLSRTTLDYTDPNSGKKAVIKYEPLTISINNENDFEQLRVYLVPDSLNSFMKVNKDGTTFKENLNELFKYTLVVVAQKGTKWYWSQQNNVKPGSTTVELNEIAESQLRVNLDHSFTKTAGENFRTELDMMIEQHAYNVQQKARQKQEEIDAAIMPVIFPFYNVDFDKPDPSAATLWEK